MTEIVKQLDQAERARMSAQTQGIAQAAVPSVTLRNGEQFVFVAHFEGSTIAMRQEHAPLRELSVEQALGQNAQAHWREAIALSRHETDQPIQMANASIQKEPSAPIRA